MRDVSEDKRGIVTAFVPFDISPDIRYGGSAGASSNAGFAYLLKPALTEACLEKGHQRGPKKGNSSSTAKLYLLDEEKGQSQFAKACLDRMRPAHSPLADVDL